MKTRSMTKELSALQAEPACLIKKHLNTNVEVNNLKLPKKNNLHYNWAKNNNLFYTDIEVRNMGLDDDYRVIPSQFICGSTETYSDKKAVAPEGYYWKEDMNQFKYLFNKKEFGHFEIDIDEYRDLFCTSFILSKNTNKINKRIHN